MGLLDTIGRVAGSVLSDINRGAPPGATLERGAQAAMRAAGEVAARKVEASGLPTVARAVATGAVMGTTLGATAARLRRGDTDGAVAGFAEGAAATARVWSGRRRE